METTAQEVQALERIAAQKELEISELQLQVAALAYSMPY
jgi:hypothetical protein